MVDKLLVCIQLSVLHMLHSPAVQDGNGHLGVSWRSVRSKGISFSEIREGIMTMFIDMTLIFFKETGTFYYFLQNIYTFLTAEDRKKMSGSLSCLNPGMEMSRERLS